MRAATQSPTHVLSRVCAGMFGSYVFAWGFIALLAAGMLRLGSDFHEATDLAWMLGLLVYLAAFCFAFIASSLTRVWAVLVGGGALMTLAGWWLARSIG